MDVVGEGVDRAPILASGWPDRHGTGSSISRPTGRVALDLDIVTFADRPPPKAGAGNELLTRFCGHEARIALNKAAELRADKRTILLVTRGADENARRYDDTYSRHHA
jgi:hypothetical protein